MKKAFIYVRVSTKEQFEKGLSPETQVKLCTEWARNNNYSIVKVYTDGGKSGTKIEGRTALKEMLANCTGQNKGTVDAIIVTDSDRFGRNTRNHLNIRYMLDKNKVELRYVNQPQIDNTPAGKLMDLMIAGFGAFQSDITGAKTSANLIEKAKLGWFPKMAPIGYKNIENPNPTSRFDKRIITIDNEIAPHIKEIFMRYLTGNYSLKDLADYLNEKGIKPPRGREFHVSYVQGTLKNPFYYGEFNWGGTLHKGKHEPLITKIQFDQIQSVLTAHNQNGNRKRIHSYLLRGFLFSHLGDRMWAELHKKKNGWQKHYYYAPAHAKGSYVETEELEKQVEKIFEGIQLSKEYSDYVLEIAQKLLDESRNSTDTERKRLEREVSNLRSAMREAEDSRFKHRTLSEESFANIYSRYENELELLEGQLGSLGKDYSNRIEGLEKLVRLSENIGASYKEAPFKLKTLYLGVFFKKFIVKGKKIVEFELTEELNDLIKEGKVFVSTNWLPFIHTVRTKYWAETVNLYQDNTELIEEIINVRDELLGGSR